MTDQTDAGTILAAAQSDNRTRLLRALRQRLAVALDDIETHPRDIASLARVMRDLETDIAELDDPEPDPTPDPTGLEDAAATPAAPFPEVGE